MQSRAQNIVCAGVAVLDQIFRIDRFPTPETKTRANAFVTTLGGCAANAAVAIARLGGHVSLAAPLGGPQGQDAIGDRIVEELARNGVDHTACTRIAPIASPLSAILVDASGARTIITHRDERLRAVQPNNPAALVASADLLLVDNRIPDFVTPICVAARDRNCPVVLDADRPMQRNDVLLSTASHVIFSAESLRATVQCDDLADALRHMREHSSSFLAVTDGNHDILWLEGPTLHHMPAFTVDVVDSLAAGDVFHGAFAFALTQQRRETEALRFAAAAAALKCTRFGGISGAPSRAEVEQMLAVHQ